MYRRFRFCEGGFVLGGGTLSLRTSSQKRISCNLLHFVLALTPKQARIELVQLIAGDRTLVGSLITGDQTLVGSLVTAILL